MSKGVDVVILAEDVRHRRLLRRYLRKRGYTHHKIRDVICNIAVETPGILFVKNHYADEVEALRHRAARVTGALTVIVDADDLEVDARIQELDALLVASAQERRGKDEHIAIVVPRRNVESWMFYLAGNEVDEETDYKPRCRNFDDTELARRFADFAWPRRELPTNCPPSLRYACAAELIRLP